MFQLFLDGLIEINRANQKLYEDLKLHGTTYHARDFQSVSCNIGIRSGKTHYIISRATENDVVILYNDTYIDIYKTYFKENNKKIPEIYTIDDIENLDFKSKKFKTIYCDDVNYYQLNYLEVLNKLIKTFYSGETGQVFVLLG